MFGTRSHGCAVARANGMRSRDCALQLHRHERGGRVTRMRMTGRQFAPLDAEVRLTISSTCEKSRLDGSRTRASHSTRATSRPSWQRRIARPRVAVVREFSSTPTLNPRQVGRALCFAAERLRSREKRAGRSAARAANESSFQTPPHESSSGSPGSRPSVHRCQRGAV